MNSHFDQPQTLNHHSFKANKKRLGRDQLRILEESFRANKKLKADFKLELAQQLGVSAKQVAIWYQNRRARHKSETKEHELRSTQQELGKVLAEKIRLEKEVCTLKNKLKKVQEMLATAHLSDSVSDDDPSYSYSSGNMWPYSNKVPGEKQYVFSSYPVNMFEKYVSNQSLLIESLHYDQETYSDCKM